MCTVKTEKIKCSSALPNINYNCPVFSHSATQSEVTETLSKMSNLPKFLQNGVCFKVNLQATKQENIQGYAQFN